jgi:hypothetical protein
MCCAQIAGPLLMDGARIGMGAGSPDQMALLNLA